MPPKADICIAPSHVCFGPKADIPIRHRIVVFAPVVASNNQFLLIDYSNYLQPLGLTGDWPDRAKSVQSDLASLPYLSTCRAGADPSIGA